MNEIKYQGFDKEHFTSRYEIIKDFVYENQNYIVYKLNPVLTEMFITGDKYEWEFGLRWSRELEHIVRDFLIEEEFKRIIKSI